MIPKLRDILDLIESFAPARLAEPWDNPGLQVGDPGKEVRKILLSLDPTQESLRAAAAQQAQLLFTHHPLIFKPITCIDPSQYPGNVICEALERGIAIACAHTNLDLAVGGINDGLAAILDLRRVEVLKEDSGQPGTGLGRIGYLANPISSAEMADKIKKALGISSIRVVGKGDRVLHRVAVVGGSGAELLALAVEKGAHLLVTGDVSHHRALEAASLGIVLIDAGHFATERAGYSTFKARFETMLDGRNWEATVVWNSQEEDPIHAT